MCIHNIENIEIPLYACAYTCMACRERDRLYRISLKYIWPLLVHRPAQLTHRAPKDHINIRILQNVVSGIPLILALGTRM